MDAPTLEGRNNGESGVLIILIVCFNEVILADYFLSRQRND